MLKSTFLEEGSQVECFSQQQYHRSVLPCPDVWWLLWEIQNFSQRLDPWETSHHALGHCVPIMHMLAMCGVWLTSQGWSWHTGPCPQTSDKPELSSPGLEHQDPNLMLRLPHALTNQIMTQKGKQNNHLRSYCHFLQGGVLYGWWHLSTYCSLWGYVINLGCTFSFFQALSTTLL